MDCDPTPTLTHPYPSHNNPFQIPFKYLRVLSFQLPFPTQILKILLNLPLLTTLNLTLKID